MKSFFTTIIWIFSTLIFGLLQLWIAIAVCFVNTNTCESYKQLFFDESPLFFISAIVSAICVDFWFSKLELPKLIVGVFFFFYPLVLIAFSIILYFLQHAQNKGNYCILAFFLYGMTLLYILICKTITYYKEDQEESDNG